MMFRSRSRLWLALAACASYCSLDGNPNPIPNSTWFVWSPRFLLALTAGVPVTVFYRYERSKLALAWREWMTKRVMEVRNTAKLDQFRF